MTPPVDPRLWEDCARSLGPDGAERLAPLRGGTLVVSGGTGFVGLWVATLCALLNDRYDYGIRLVLIARNEATLADKAPHLRGRSDTRFMAEDVRRLIDLPAETTWVVHAAGTPDNRFHVGHPLETVQTITEGTHRVLRAAERCGELRMIAHLSSALVYGSRSAEAGAIAEDQFGALDPAAVSSIYAEAKRCSETLCAAARGEIRVPSIIVRPFTFIGPFQAIDAPWALNNFLHAALNDRSLRILGDGRTVRSYLYGSDAAYTLLRMLTGARAGGIYNLGHPEGISLGDLAEMVVRKTGKPLEIRRDTGGALLGVSRLVPDMGRCAREFGFKPAFTLSEAIDRALAWNRARADAS